MVSAYHRSIQKAIITLGEEWKGQKRVRDVYEGNKRPLPIVDTKTKYVVNYQPDVYYVLRNNKKLIFEILDSEERKQDIIIADIIRSILVENVEALIFIYPGSKDTELTILEALKTMYKGLTDKGIPISKLPSDKKTGPYAITRREAKTENLIMKKLEKYLNPQ